MLCWAINDSAKSGHSMEGGGGDGRRKEKGGGGGGLVLYILLLMGLVEWSVCVCKRE